MTSEPLTLFPPDAEHRLGFDVLRARLDSHARTPYGRERLAALAPSADRAEVDARLARAGEMQSVLGFDDPFPLGSADDIRSILKRLGPKDSAVDGEALHAVGRVLTMLRSVHEYLTQGRKAKYPGLGRVAERIVPLKALEEHVARTIDDQGRVKDDASPELLRLTRSLADRQGRLRETLLKALRTAIAQGWATEDQPTIRGGRAVIPVRAEAKRKVQGFVHDVSASGQTVYIEPAASLDLNNEIRELESERRREIERILREVSGHVRAHRADIEASLEALGQLDALASIARLGNEVEALVPELNDDGVIRLVRARNPVLALHFRREASRKRSEGESADARTVIPLSVDLGGDYRTLVITGPNAGGKSVAMKSVGLLCLMVQCGLPIPAAPGTSLPLFTRLFVDLGDQQSIQDDLSTFTSHLHNIRRMLADADDRSLVLIDEAGTGTDPAEGGALAEAVLRRLTEAGARTIATTHHGTLKAFAHAAEGVENGSMEFDRETLAPTYRFQAGIPGSSYAFEIATRVGLDDGVVAEARHLVGEGKTALEDLIADFEARSQQAAERLAEAEAPRHRGRAYPEGLRAAARPPPRRPRAPPRRGAGAGRGDRPAGQCGRRKHHPRDQGGRGRARGHQGRARLAGGDEGDDPAAQEERPAPRRETRARRAARAQGSARRQGPLAARRPGPPRRRHDHGRDPRVSGKEAVVAFGTMHTRAKLNRLTKVGGPRQQRVEFKAPTVDRSNAVPITRVQVRVDVRGQRVEEARARGDALHRRGRRGQRAERRDPPRQRHRCAPAGHPRAPRRSQRRGLLRLGPLEPGRRRRDAGRAAVMGDG